MRSKWHTLAVAGLLGLSTSGTIVAADDNSTDSWQPQPTARSAARKAAANPGENPSDTGRLSQELLRQAMVELEANRFDTARRLARRAAAIGVSAGFSGVNPEQVLAEIDRKERGAQVVVPAVSADTRRKEKARAIELLDRGILALDEKRFDEAEQCARQAAQLRVTWDRFDYRPESLLADIRRERPSVAVVRDAHLTTAAVETHPPTEWANRSNEPVAASIPQQPVAQPDAGATQRPPAEALLAQAMDDLRAGRDELARHGLEQALGAIPGNAQSAPVASFGGYTVASNRPMGLLPSGVNPAGAANLPATPSVFFPVRRDQPSLMPPPPSAADVALKPMHDPYLGDDSVTTDKMSAGAQTMRESMPTGAPINPVYMTRNATPSMPDPPVQRTGYDSPTAYSPTMPPRVQTAPDAAGLSPQLSWLEKMSTPLPPQAMPGQPPYGQPGSPYGQTAPAYGQAPPPYAQTAPPQRGYNLAPIAPPASADTQWTAGRVSATSATDPTPSAQPSPGFFQKMWGAISGE